MLKRLMMAGMLIAAVFSSRGARVFYQSEGAARSYRFR